MSFGAKSQIGNTRNERKLDELLGLSSDSNQAGTRGYTGDRPATRHGRNTDNDPYQPIVLPSASNNQNARAGKAVIDNWQRESDETDTTGSDNEFTVKLEAIRQLRLQKQQNTQPKASELNVPDTTGPTDHSYSTEPNVQITDGLGAVTGLSSTVTRLSSTSDSKASTSSQTNSNKENRTLDGKLSKNLLSISSRRTSGARSTSIGSLAQPRSESMQNYKQSASKSSRLTSSVAKSSSNSSAYEIWLREKAREAKKKRQSDEEKKQEEEKVKEERKQEAQKLYEVWKENTDKTIRLKKQKEREKMNAIKVQEEEQMRKKNEEAKNMFEAWKRERAQPSKSLHPDTRKPGSSHGQAVKVKQSKCQQHEKTFDAWYEEKKRKERELQSKMLESRKKQEDELTNEKEYRKVLANEAYDLWLQIKEHERKFAQTMSARIAKMEAEVSGVKSVPWIPAGNVVPRKFATSRRRRASAKQDRQSLLQKMNRSKSALR